MIRIGHGYDIHKIVKGRPLVLGGVRFETGFRPFGPQRCRTAHSRRRLRCACWGQPDFPDIGHRFSRTADPMHWKGRPTATAFLRM